MVNETGIPGPVVKPDENGNSTLAARVEFSLPRIAEQFQNNGSGETSVFTNLTQESEGIVAEAKLPACNLGAPVPHCQFQDNSRWRGNIQLTVEQ